MARLREVADRAGVHPSTASRALDPARSGLVNAETRARVQAAAKELGFQTDALARSLRIGRTQALGIIVVDLGNPFWAPAIRGIENNLDGRGYLAYITETQDDEARLGRVIEHLLSRRVDAIIMMAARQGNETILRYAARQVPVVLGVRGLPTATFPGVVHDDERGGALAAQHLVDLGHTRLAQLKGPGDVTSFTERARGFRQTATSLGATVIDIGGSATATTPAQGRQLMEELLATQEIPPTGVFAHNDTLAIGAIQALRARGLRCPQDVSMIGYNDSPMTEFTDPPLSTIALPAYELGRIAADMALSRIDDPSLEPVMLSLPPRLEARASTTSPRKAKAKSVRRPASNRA